MVKSKFTIVCYKDANGPRIKPETKGFNLREKAMQYCATLNEKANKIDWQIVDIETMLDG